jgi:hypothetical protein
MASIRAAPALDNSALPRWMNPYEVFQGTLNSLEDLEGDYLANIAGIQVILPAMIGPELQSQVGQRVGIIYLGRQDYKVRKPEAS